MKPANVDTAASGWIVAPSIASSAMPGYGYYGWNYEYKSEAELFGLPLIHIANGIDPETGRMRVAKGILAIGNIAIGVVALGGLAVGGITIGGASIGCSLWEVLH